MEFISLPFQLEFREFCVGLVPSQMDVERFLPPVGLVLSLAYISQKNKDLLSDSYKKEGWAIHRYQDLFPDKAVWSSLPAGSASR